MTSTMPRGFSPSRLCHPGSPRQIAGAIHLISARADLHSRVTYSKLQADREKTLANYRKEQKEKHKMDKESVDQEDDARAEIIAERDSAIPEGDAEGEKEDGGGDSDCIFGAEAMSDFGAGFGLGVRAFSDLSPRERYEERLRDAKAETKSILDAMKVEEMVEKKIGRGSSETALLERRYKHSVIMEEALIASVREQISVDERDRKLKQETTQEIALAVLEAISNDCDDDLDHVDDNAGIEATHIEDTGCDSDIDIEDAVSRCSSGIDEEMDDTSSRGSLVIVDSTTNNTGGLHGVTGRPPENDTLHTVFKHEDTMDEGI